MLDEISLKIVKILQEKARIPNVEVARKVGMAPSAVLERIRKLEKQGFIDGYEVRLNPKRFRSSLVAFLMVRMEPGGDLDTAARSFAGIPAVQEVHYIAGEDGFLLKARTADTEELKTLLRERIMPAAAVRSVKTHIVLSTQKETARIPLKMSETGNGVSGKDE